MIETLLRAITGPGGLVILAMLVFAAVIAGKIVFAIADRLYSRRGKR